MMGPSHRVVGVLSWCVLAGPAGATAAELFGGAVLAAATSHGRLSPDMDRYPWLAKVIPGGHRGILHWWPLPALALWFVPQAGPFWWVLAAVGLAWASHIIADGVFGRIPVLPRVRSGWMRFGVGLRTGGRVEKWFAIPVICLCAAYLLWRQYV